MKPINFLGRNSRYMPPFHDLNRLIVSLKDIGTNMKSTNYCYPFCQNQWAVFQLPFLLCISLTSFFPLSPFPVLPHSLLYPSTYIFHPSPNPHLRNLNPISYSFLSSALSVVRFHYINTLHIIRSVQLIYSSAERLSLCSIIFIFKHVLH